MCLSVLCVIVGTPCFSWYSFLHSYMLLLRVLEIQASLSAWPAISSSFFLFVVLVALTDPANDGQQLFASQQAPSGSPNAIGQVQ